MTADKLFISSNHYVAAGGTRFAVVRYGNVIGGRGSVIPFFSRLAAAGEPLPITDRRMTRFFITLPQAVDFVVQALEDMKGGELFVPRIPSMRITDLAKAIAPDAPIVDIGIRPGEKLHEEMISVEDAQRTVRQAHRYVVQPTLAVWGGYEAPAGDAVEDGFSYSSDKNDEWLQAEDLRQMIEDLDR